MGEGKLTPLTTPTPLIWQSRNIAHVITFTISPHTRHLVKIAAGVTAPHIARVTTQFFYLFLSLYAKSFYRPRAQAVEPIFDTRYTNRRVFTQGSAFWGLEHRIFTSSPSKLPKTPFWGTYNGKPMGNTYSHNCMMHRDTTLKFGTLFYLAKYLEHT